MKTSQTTKLLALLSDGLPHSTLEVMEKVYGSDHLGLARIGARVWDIKKLGHQVIGWKDKKNPAIYWYQMVVKLEGETLSERSAQLGRQTVPAKTKSTLAEKHHLGPTDTSNPSLCAEECQLSLALRY